MVAFCCQVFHVADAFCPSRVSQRFPLQRATGSWHCVRDHQTMQRYRASRAQPTPRPAGLRAAAAQGGATPVVVLTSVLGADVAKCTRLLAASGARDVVVEDAGGYGSKVIASLEVEPLTRLAPEVAALVKPSGRMGVSGLAAAEAETLAAAFSPFFEDIKQIDDEGSVRVTGWRKVHMPVL